MVKLPPIEKIPEAFSAIADGRVTMSDDANEARVKSSDGTKEYTVTWNPETNFYTSNDNATYWQLYPGYPVLAVMMLQGLLNYDETLAKDWKGIDWNKLNNEYKRNYAKAVEYVIAERGLDAGLNHNEFNRIMEQVKELPITIKRSKIKPPKAG